MQPKLLYSWNVNGIKAIMRKNFKDFIRGYDPELLAIQETKSQDEEVQKLLGTFDQHYIYCNSAEQKGYAGTAVLSKVQPNHVQYGIDDELHDHEGRTITLEFDDYYFLNVYVPNSGNGLKRLDYREQWDEAFREYIKKLDTHKPVIVTGDFNVAHEEIDIARPKQNYNKSAGFTQTEIDGLDEHLNIGLIDTFRQLYPDKEVYTYWSYRAKARERNVGWRIDYFFVSRQLFDKVQDSYMLNEVQGSDHCPIVLELQ